MKRLPKKIKMLWGNKANSCEEQVGQVYELHVEEWHECGWEGYWSAIYGIKPGIKIPCVHIDGGIHFLCTVETSKDNAINAMFERLDGSEGQWEEVE